MNRNNLNELQEGERSKMPVSVVRTVSLDKLKSGSPLSQSNNNVEYNKSDLNKGKSTVKLYQKLLEKKLGVQNNEFVLKNKKNEDSSNLMNQNQKISKKEQLKRIVDEKEMKECTFKPNIKSIGNHEIRNPSIFFADQINFNKQKQDKIQQMRQMIKLEKQKQNTFKPNIIIRNNQSQHSNPNQVYNRLFDNSKNRNHQISRQASQDTMRTNSITKSKRFKGISRGDSLQSSNKMSSQKSKTLSHLTVQSKQLKKHQNILLESQDLKSKEHLVKTKLNQIVTKKDQNQVSNIVTKRLNRDMRIDVNINEKKDNSKSDEIYIMKLMKEMTIVIQKCNLPLVPNYMEVSLFFQKMNFITCQPSIVNRKYIHQIWSMLQGDVFDGVSIISLMRLMYAIMGCHNVLLVNKFLKESWLFDEKLYKNYEKQRNISDKSINHLQNLLILSEKDSKQIKFNFDQLFVNRLKKGESQLIKADHVEEYTFKPTISKGTSQLAEKYRNRILKESQKLVAEQRIRFQVPQNGLMNHIDILMLDEKRKDAIIQLKREQMMRQKKKIEDQSMTIQNHSQRSSHNSSKNASHKDRNRQLYQIGKQINQNKKDKTKDQIEEEKWKKQLTFKPNIQNKNTKIQGQSDNHIPDFEKAIFRMHQGRKLRNDHSLKRSQQQKNVSPLLYLNVVMQGSESVKVPVFTFDNMKTITQKVRLMMELDGQNNNIKLERILKMQIAPALKEMGLENFMNQ